MAFGQEVPVLKEFDAASRPQQALAELLSDSAQLQNCWGCGEVFISQQKSAETRICIPCREDIAQQRINHMCIAFESDKPIR